MKLMPFVTKVDFPGMVARATVTVDDEYGGGSFDLVGTGLMEFSLAKSNDAETFDVQVDDLVINFQETGIKLRDFDLQVPAFTINMCHLDLKQSHGRWHRDRSHIDLQLAVRLDPKHFPFMFDLGYGSSVTILVTESGTLSWGERALLDTHAEPFRLPAPLEFLTVSPSQFCNVRAELWVSLDCGMGFRLRSTEVWICPGEDVCLDWGTKNAQGVSLTPGGPLGGDTGNELVSPTSTQAYVLTAQNGCKVTKQVTVRVVRPGETINTLSATWDPWRPCVWRVEIPQALVSKNVLVQEMRHVKCSGGTLTHPEWAYSHTDPDGAVFTGNVKADVWTDIPDQPLGGVWEFSPVGVDDCRPREGQNGWEPACFEGRLGCR